MTHPGKDRVKNTIGHFLHHSQQLFCHEDRKNRYPEGSILCSERRDNLSTPVSIASAAGSLAIESHNSCAADESCLVNCRFNGYQNQSVDAGTTTPNRQPQLQLKYVESCYPMRGNKLAIWEMAVFSSTVIGRRALLHLYEVNEALYYFIYAMERISKQGTRDQFPIRVGIYCPGDYIVIVGIWLQQSGINLPPYLLYPALLVFAWRLLDPRWRPLVTCPPERLGSVIGEPLCVCVTFPQSA